MTLDTQMALALLQELLMALRANDADGYKSWLALGIEELGRDAADGEVAVMAAKKRRHHLTVVDAFEVMASYSKGMNPIHPKRGSAINE